MYEQRAGNTAGNTASAEIMSRATESIHGKLDAVRSQIDASVELLEATVTRAFGNYPSAESAKGAPREVPNGSLSQINSAFDDINGRLLILADLSSRLQMLA